MTTADSRQELVAVERHGAVAVVRLQRPDRMNALGRELVAALGEAVEVVASDETLRAMVLAGDRRAFSAGADIEQLRDLQGAADFGRFVDELGDLLDRIEALAKPSIAAVEGVALGGGCELALACDLRVASGRARFGLPEIKLGLLPGAGGTQRISRIAPTLARRMLLTGSMVSAGQAHAAGLVDELVDEGDAEAAALRLGQDLAGLAPLAIAVAKQLMQATDHVALRTGLVMERNAVAVLFDSADRQEGIAAFLGKRQPNFEGR